MPFKCFTVALLVFLCNTFVLGAVERNDVKPGYIFTATPRSMVPPPRSNYQIKTGKGLHDKHRAGWTQRHPVIALGDPDIKGDVPVALLSHNVPEGTPKASRALYGIQLPMKPEEGGTRVDGSGEVDLVKRTVSINNLNYSTYFRDWQCLTPEALKKLKNAMVEPNAQNSGRTSNPSSLAEGSRGTVMSGPNRNPVKPNTQKTNPSNRAGGSQGVMTSGPSQTQGSSDTLNGDGWQVVKKGKSRHPARP